MKVTVCIKQVPGTTNVDIDPESGVLKRNGVDSKMNPYDLYALETALMLKKETDCEITAISMGPPQTSEIIREAYMMGADKGVLISDRQFAGADVLATAFTLSQGIKRESVPDIIICGKMTTDGDTAQVGPEIAEFLNITHVTNVSSIDEVTDSYVVVKRDMPFAIETVKVQFPCLLTVNKGIYEPRLPSFKLKLATSDRVISTLGLADMEDSDAKKYGLNGSPTQVLRIFPPEHNNQHEMWEGCSSDLSDKLFNKLSDMKFIEG